MHAAVSSKINNTILESLVPVREGGGTEMKKKKKGV